MNSLPLALFAAKYRLRAIRDFDLDVLNELFPESGAYGPELADRRRWLRNAESIAWGKNPRIRLVMEEIDTGQAIAGFTLERVHEQAVNLRYGFRASTALTQIAGFMLVKDFAHLDMNLITVRVDMISGQDPLAAVAEQIGYQRAVTLREWWRDGSGDAHDWVTYEAINPAWEVE